VPINKQEDKQVSSRNISYYNEIALDYDAILDKDNTNKNVRSKVIEYFTANVKPGIVLDFGGGTGKDTEWMIKKGYSIIFCEPSPAMRQIAIEKTKKEFSTTAIDFVAHEFSDFRSWQTTIPFKEKADAVLANFAVINCIPDIELLLEKMLLVLKPGGHFIMLLLDYSFTKKLRSNLRGTLLSLLTGDTVNFSINYNGRQQTVFTHSVKAIKNAMAGNYIFQHYERIPGSEFCLIHVTRK